MANPSPPPPDDITDPLSELYGLARFLRKRADGNQSWAKALGALMETTGESPSVIRALNAVCERIATARAIVASSQLMTDGQRKTTLRALDQVQLAFSATRLGETTSALLDSCFKEHDLVAIQMMGESVRAEHPLRRVSRESRDSLVKEVIRVRADLEADPRGIHPAVVAGMKRGLDDLLFALMHFEIFGHAFLAARGVENHGFLKRCYKAVTDPETQAAILGVLGLVAAIGKAVYWTGRGVQGADFLLTYGPFVIEHFQALTGVLGDSEITQGVLGLPAPDDPEEDAASESGEPESPTPAASSQPEQLLKV